jgi:hypothetical protein
MGRSILGAGLCMLILASAVQAGPVFLGTQGTTLYRISDGGVETFTLSTDLTSMAVGPGGVIWGSALTDAGTNGLRELYTLDDPLGVSPSLSLVGEFLADNTPSLTWVDDTLYGVQKTPGGSDPAVLVTIDTLGLTQQVVGDTGEIGAGFNGTAYDPSTDSFYGIRGGGLIPPAELYEVDYSLSGGTDPATTLIGELGLSYVNGGAEWFGDTKYALIQERLESGLGDLLLGTVNPDTGEFTQTLVVDAAVPGAVGLAVIPEPATLSLLGALAIVVLRRRR